MPTHVAGLQDTPDVGLKIRPPKGPVARKWSGFFMLGEPGWYEHAKEAVFVGGVGSGKTNALVSSLLISALTYPGSRIALVRDTRENLKASTLQTLEELAEPLIASGKYSHIQSRNLIQIGDDFDDPKRHSQVFIFGLDDPKTHKKLVGTEWFRVYVDQLESVDRKIYEQLILRIRQKVYHNGRLASNYIKSTANIQYGRKTWLYKRFNVGAREITEDVFEKRVEGNINGKRVVAYRVMFKSEYGENLSLNPQYDEMMVLAEEQAKPFMAGDFEASYDLLFPEFENDKHVYHEIGGEDYSRFDLYVGMDFGISSPTVFVYGLVDRYTREIFIDDEYVENGLDAAEYATALANRLHHYVSAGVRNVYIYADPNIWNRTGVGNTVAEVFERVIGSTVRGRISFDKAYIKGSAGARLQEDTINAIKEGLRARTVRVRNSAVNVINVLMDATWEDIRKDRHPMTDTFDALRYLVNNVPPLVVADDDDDEESEEYVAWWGYKEVSA